MIHHNRSFSKSENCSNAVLLNFSVLKMIRPVNLRSNSIKMNENKAIKSGIWYTISNFVMKSIGFLTTPIFTRMLTKAEYGEFSNIQTWMMIILYISSLNLESSLLRACHEFKEDINCYIHSIISLSLLSTGIFWCIFSLFKTGFSTLLSMDHIYINCMFAYLLFQPAISIFQAAERFQYKYVTTVFTSMTISVGGSLLSVILVTIMHNKLLGRVIGYILPYMIIGLIVIIYYFIFARKIKFRYWKYALGISLPYIPHLLSLYLLNNMDKTMIRKMCGAEDLGLYSLAYTCGMIITILVGSVNNAFSPWMAEKLQKKEFSSLYKVSVPYVAIFSYISIGIVLITPEILYILGGPEYMKAIYVMPPVASGCLLQFIYCMYVNVEQYEKKTFGMALASLLATFINYILNYIFIGLYGYIAAAYTTTIGYFSLFMMHMYLVKRIGFSKIYNNIGIFLIALSASGIIISINFILNSAFIRYFFFIIYLCIGCCFINKQYHRIKTTIKR